MVAALGGAESERAGGHRLADDGVLPRGLVVGGGALGGVGAQHVAADGAMANLRRDVDAKLLPFDPVEELGEALPLPVEHGVQDVEIDRLDAGKHAHEELAVLGLAGGQGVAAVAHDHGGGAVPRRAREQAVPHDLGVVVGVDVDEAGGDDSALGVNDTPGGLVEPALGRDPPAADAHVGAVAGQPAAVDHGPILDEQVEGHGCVVLLKPCPAGWA